MKLVIDGYNLIKNGHIVGTITEAERIQFLNRLHRYTKKKGLSALIVFDGGPYRWPFKETYKNLEVVYSGLLETADHYIVSYIDRHKDSDILLISSDRELRNHAAMHSVYSLTSQDFSIFVYDALDAGPVVHTKKQSTLYKFSSASSDSELDELMQEGTRSMMIKKEDVAFVETVIKKEKVQKHERALLQKLKKL